MASDLMMKPPQQFYPKTRVERTAEPQNKRNSPRSLVLAYRCAVESVLPPTLQTHQIRQLQTDYKCPSLCATKTCALSVGTVAVGPR